MLSNNTDPQASPLPDPKATGTPKAPAVLDPHSPIEVASGTGTGNDPVATDHKPPGVYDGGDSLA